MKINIFRNENANHSFLEDMQFPL